MSPASGRSGLWVDLAWAVTIENLGVVPIVMVEDLKRAGLQ